ncbi:uncharacterized protein BDZ99DRAFT_465057 [Mytilinidion resinicola]|uniref:Apple domain-containing protein n=1 Tax=Mytilinidion resinicola TaxID=574789 RepID=A0A6A6YE86_9PEZI|nr:uncharacterized protein BDZ99DRAFT_465057 [Mytilinidion resinicola]KAF2807126.1 hypothetical protein BDZ99DRAFT_465057 [Mytilinidion resinicola]
MLANEAGVQDILQQKDPGPLKLRLFASYFPYNKLEKTRMSISLNSRTPCRSPTPDLVRSYFLDIPRDGLSTNCRNGTVVPSIQGLNYTQYCNYDLNGHDLGWGNGNSLQECIDSCTSYHPACFGVTWDPLRRFCWLTDGSIAASDLQPVQSNFVSALVFPSQTTQQSADFVCPYPNLSTHKARSGMEFKMLCGAMFPGDSADDFLDAMHVESLDDCLDQCAGHHPLCSRVTYGVDLQGRGWLNCGLKKFDENVKPISSTKFMTHSLEAVIKPPKKVDCVSPSVRKDNAGRSFKTSCSDLRNLNTTEAQPLATYHEVSIDDCLQHCSTANSTCATVLFDAGLQSGYQNCYLFDSFPPPQHRNSDFTFMYLESLSSQFQPPPPPKPEKKGKIAGAVVGSLIGTALLIWLLVWWCRWRKNKQNFKHEEKTR